MQRDETSTPRGLLAGGGPAGAAWSYLTTDGGGGLTTDGGGGGSTDGGGSGGPRRRSAMVAEAIRRSQAGIVRGDDRLADPPQRQVAGKQPLQAKPVPVIAAWDSAVKSDLVQARLLSGVWFDRGEVWHRGTANPVMLFAATAPQEALLQNQAEWVRRRARFREDRMPEIEVQVAALWPFWDAVLNLDIRRAPRTHELLHAGLLFAASVVLQIKHALHAKRPSEVSPLVMPIIEVPGHASFPSGHATAAHMLSNMLIGLLEPDATRRALLHRLAYRVAYNREVAGVHYPVDSVAGRALGTTLATYLKAVATGSKTVDTVHVDAEWLGWEPQNDEEDLKQLSRRGDALAADTQDVALRDLPGVVQETTEVSGLGGGSLIADLWDLAIDELRTMGRLT